MDGSGRLPRGWGPREDPFEGTKGSLVDVADFPRANKTCLQTGGFLTGANGKIVFCTSLNGRKAQSQLVPIGADFVHMNPGVASCFSPERKLVQVAQVKLEKIYSDYCQVDFNSPLQMLGDSWHHNLQRGKEDT